METLTDIDKKILYRISKKDTSIPCEITKEQYRASIWHLSDLELIQVICDMGGNVIDAIVLDKGYFIIQKTITAF